MVLKLLKCFQIFLDYSVKSELSNCPFIDERSFFFLTAAAPPNNTLFVSNLSFDVNVKKLRSVFQKAVEITVPKSKGKARG